MPRADALPCLVLGTLALFTGAASLLRHRTTEGGRRGIGGGGFGLFGGPGGYGGGGHPRPHERHGHGGPRRALRQIARESEQVPFAFLPGTSGPAPNYWMLRDAHQEIPPTVGACPAPCATFLDETQSFLVHQKYINKNKILEK